jgi:hypothetical protein
MADKAGDTNEFSWAPLGEARWRELAQSAGASELQLRFAVARFGGATATGAARLAGYSGDKDALRRAGYAAARSTAVANLLELASVNAPGDAKITRKELAAKLAKLCRSSDPNVSLKAIEAFQKFEAAEKAENARQEDAEYLDEDASYRDLVCGLPVSGRTAAGAMGLFFNKYGTLTNFKFLQETAPIVAQRFAGDWERWHSKHDVAGRAILDAAAAGAVLEGDNLVSAVLAKYPKGAGVKSKETSAEAGETANAQ